MFNAHGVQDAILVHECQRHEPQWLNRRVERKGTERKGKERKGKDRKGKDRKGKEKREEETRKDNTRKDCAFWRQFNEKPNMILGCPGNKCVPFG